MGTRGTNFTNARLTSSRVIRGGAFDEQVQVVMLVMFEKGDLKEKSYFLPLFENVLIVDAMELCFYK